MTTSTRKASRIRLVSACAAAMLAGGSLYLNALHNPFVYDDFRTVVDNGSIASLRDLPTIVLHEIARPLTNLSLAVDRAIWGTAPFGFHLTNLLLHVVNVILVFFVAARIWSDGNRNASSDRSADDALVGGLAAALFATHPIMSEAVGYISSRSDLLCTLFLLSALLAARRLLLHGCPKDMAFTWLFWIVAMLCKETAVVFPLMVLTYAHLLLADVTTPRSTRWLVAPLVAVMVAAAGARLLLFMTMEGGSLRFTNIASAVVAFWQYLRPIATLAGQAIFHPAVVLGGADDWRVWTGSMVLIVAGVAGWKARHRNPGAVFGAAALVLLLAPALLLGVADTTSGVAEHRAYLPMVGFVLLVAALAGQATPLVQRFRSTRLLAPMAVAAVVLMLGGRTFLRNMVWADPVNLWEEATINSPSEWLPFAALGQTLHSAGRHQEAIVAYRRALDLNGAAEPEALNLVVCLSELGRTREAAQTIARLEQAHPASSSAAIGRGVMAAIAGRPSEARGDFLEAVSLDPRNVMARQWLMILAEGTGDRGEALHRCYELQRLTPGRASVSGCLARVESPTALR